MFRYLLFVAAVIASTGYAIAAIAPDAPTTLDPRTTTVIEKNMAFPVLGELKLETCATEDCAED